MNTFLFTSESVTEGHPDKVSDRISDTVLDLFLENDNNSLVACETFVTTDRVILGGETSSTFNASKELIEQKVREAILDIGYSSDKVGFNGNSCKIDNYLHEQSSDIRQGVELGEEIGAGDQGLMFGYACDETSTLMPLAIDLSHRLTSGLSLLRKKTPDSFLLPDGKAQVTLEYDTKTGKPIRINNALVSTQHKEEVEQADLVKFLKLNLFNEYLPSKLIDNETKIHINPTGRFVVGGPNGDAGLTGRKIIVDTYGGYAPHGGGAFSGKDPTKVDRSAAYMCRYISKNIVASGIASKFQVQLAYAIGMVDPVGIYFNDFGTLKVDAEKVLSAIKQIFKLTPKGIINSLDLRRPIYSKTSAYGHFGRELADFTWEKTDKISDIKSIFNF